MESSNGRQIKLIDKNDIELSLCKKIKNFFCYRNIKKNYTIYLNTKTNITRCHNVIKNHRYNIFTFIPFVLFEQMRYFSNQVYVGLFIIQFFDMFKVGLIADYIAPLLIVFTITFIKEFYDDFKRHKKDDILNNQEVVKLTKDGKHIIKSKDIKIGDFLEITKDQRIPADLIVLKTNQSNGTTFIRTDQLDGETDWKLRKAPICTHKLNINELLEMNAEFHIDPPSTFIYEFKGVLYNESVVSLSLENTIWANSVLATDLCIGVVIYTGEETRAQMNSTKPKAKFGILDTEINMYNKILFVLMILLSFTIITVRGYGPYLSNNIVSLIRFVVLLNAILPIGLRVNMEIAKTVNSVMINKNELAPETIVRNSNIPEELGRIELIFTDKTGTLTRNEMIFKQLSFNEHYFINEDNIEKYIQIITEEYHSMSIINSFVSSPSIRSEREGSLYLKKRKSLKKEIGILVKETMLALALCNNVTPINDSMANGEITYQASSPDELALVNISKRLNTTLIFRDESIIRIRNAIDEIEEFEILASFPFTSENKRMGIILKNIHTNSIIFYMKGSESVILNFVTCEYRSVIKENTENLASRGLRTLVLVQKYLSQEYYEKWAIEYKEALISMEKREEKVKKAFSLLETSMEFLCVTGVEDILQHNVIETIESLKDAGIKIWMLTGDKVETATCIAISSGIKDKSSSLFYIKENSEEKYVEESLIQFSKLKNSVMIIDGECLDIALNNFEKLFFTTTINAPSVACCRCSPTQKAKIVSLVKKYTPKRTLAIGDGGNDVAMIQQANCGIGIVGKEGKQASLAADFSITEFHHLQFLLLWFGRQSYKNTSKICNFVVHRGMIIAFMQYIFCFLFYCFPIPLFNGLLMMGYTSLFTNFPVFSLLLDRDTQVKNVLKFPPIYKELQKGRELNLRTFLFWTFISLLQATIIIYGTIIVFKDQIYLKLVTLTFTNLIFAELLNIYTQIKHFHWMMIVSIVCSLITYLLTLVFLTSVIDIVYLVQGWNSVKVFLISLTNWLPFFIYMKLKVKFYPQVHEKLNKMKVSFVKPV